MIIAIDGPAASGKGTLGKKLAAHYGLRHLDTGLIYRAVAKVLLDAGPALAGVPPDEDARGGDAQRAHHGAPDALHGVRVEGRLPGAAADAVRPEVSSHGTDSIRRGLSPRCARGAGRAR